MKGRREMTALALRTRALRLAPLGALVLLAGCLSVGGDAPRQMITLTAIRSAPAGALGSDKAGPPLVMLDLEADRRIDVQRVLVQIDDATIAYLTDAVWVERPARPFRRLVAEAIRVKTGRLVLEPGDEATIGKEALSGRLLDIGYHARDQKVVVRFDAIRTDASGAVRARRFEAEVGGIGPKAEQVAPALNKAANDVATQVADWVE